MSTYDREQENVRRRKLEEYVASAPPETPEQKHARIQVYNTAKELRRRLQGFVPLGMDGLPTYAKDEHTLMVFTKNERQTKEKVMEAIWRVAPNCSAVRVEVVY